MARKHDLLSVAFPAISTGIYGYPMPEAADVAAMAVADELRATPDAFAQILFVCFDEAATAVYSAAVGKRLRSPA